MPLEDFLGGELLIALAFGRLQTGSVPGSQLGPGQIEEGAPDSCPLPYCHVCTVPLEQGWHCPPALGLRASGTGGRTRAQGLRSFTRAAAVPASWGLRSDGGQGGWVGTQNKHSHGCLGLKEVPLLGVFFMF